MGTLRTRTAGSRLAIVLTTVIVTTVVLAGGVALATVTLNSVGTGEIIDDSIRSQDIKDGAVQGVDIRNDTIKSNDIRNGTIKPGDLSAIARPRWATIGYSDGGWQVIRGRGVLAASRANTGEFTVHFNSPVVGCGWLATRNSENGEVDPGETGVERLGHNFTNSVIVRTWDSDGVVADPSVFELFTVQVVC